MTTLKQVLGRTLTATVLVGVSFLLAEAQTPGQKPEPVMNGQPYLLAHLDGGRDLFIAVPAFPNKRRDSATQEFGLAFPPRWTAEHAARSLRVSSPPIRHPRLTAGIEKRDRILPIQQLFFPEGVRIGASLPGQADSSDDFVQRHTIRLFTRNPGNGSTQ